MEWDQLSAYPGGKYGGTFLEESRLTSPFLFVFGEPSYAEMPLLDPGTGGGLW
jgi:hypothetical protein